jgi:CubicO group peptidase (beta-lactamase class C family)
MKIKKEGLVLTSFVFIMAVFLVSCQTAEQDNTPFVYEYQVPEQVNDGWKTAHMYDEGLNPVSLIEMMEDYFGKKSNDVHSILIVKNNKLVFEEYWAGHDFGPPETGWKGEYLQFNRDTLHCLHSATKSFASAMMGIAIDREYIRDENEKMFPFFPEYAHLKNSQKDKIRLKHILTMTSGLEWNEGDISLKDLGNDLRQLIISYDPIGYILGKPLVHEPGTHYYYSGGDTNLVGDVVRRATGQNVDLLGRQYLFNHMGITNFYWIYFPNDPDVVYCSGDLYLRPRDMAKFGQLFLNKGVWKGRRLISEEWVNKSITPHTETDGRLDSDTYGFQWWILDYYVKDQQVHSFSARGWGGQQIIVFPDLNAVAVFTGGNYNVYPPVHHLVRTYILPALL